MLEEELKSEASDMQPNKTVDPLNQRLDFRRSSMQTETISNDPLSKDIK